MPKVGLVLELSADEFRRQMDINVIGPIIATQAFRPAARVRSVAEGVKRADRDDQAPSAAEGRFRGLRLAFLRWAMPNPSHFRDRR
jgi:NAD(P)-dependent dehydrogenase (short-subunit alcohol dehydrogenase family)